MLRRCLLLTLLLLGAAAPSAHAVTVTVNPASVTEGGTLRFELSDTPLAGTATVTVTGTATSGVDFQAPDPTVSFFLGPPAPIEIKTNPDTTPELDETVIVTVTPNALGNSPGTGTGTITDDDPPVLAVFAGKGSEAQGYVDLPVGRSPVSRATRVAYTVAPGTAGPGDFGATGGEITIPAGAGAGTIRVPVVDDAEDEDDETFTVTIASPDAATVAPSGATATATVTSNDLRAISVGDVSVTEGDGAPTVARVPVTLSAPTAKTVTAQFATVALTAKSPRDFTSRTGSITFAPGQTQQVIDVQITSDDAIEPSEQFAVLVGRETNATTARGTALVKIADDDVAQGDEVAPNVKVATPKRRGRSVSVKVTCPKGEQTCRSRVTLYTRADRRNKVKSLRRERRIGSRTVTVKGGASRTVKLTVPKSIARAARKARKLKVRAFVVTTDSNDNQDTTTKNATLRFR
jgi:chitinase